ncbi:phage major capsid protein [Bradyrhizobium sp. 200]|uniref:phage major capsid protein n=1 Tax=Bradyrhizobium sp. 200 TaxID=2782665 RepID=UPI001FFFEEAB|nr:phage major capsid protein [Bradyrhizobium sp. 200]UPJ53336.1 phage major capsid protein [Bradyrhizobium sp. 200]
MSNVAEKLDEISTSINTFKSEYGTRLTEIERYMARLKVPANDNNAVNEFSLGHALAATEAFKQLDGGRLRGRASVEMATITSGVGTVGAGTSAGTSLVPGHRVPVIITPAERAFTVRDLIAPGKTGLASIEYVKETGFTNNARPVTEGATKPTSDLTFNMVTTPVRTIAHLFDASLQILADAPTLASYIDVRATYGLKLKEEDQLLWGSGVGQNILGILPQATTFDTGLRKVGDTKIDILRRAILQVRQAEYRASGIILNPDDVADIETTKDDQGRYIYINVVEGGSNRLWKLPIVETTVMPSGEFAVGAWNLAAQIFDRQQAVLEVSTEHADNFARNLCTFRCEERLALAVYRPESFVHGEFDVESE